MTARTDNSDLGRYSPAYATGRSAFALQSKSEVEVEQWNTCFVKTDLTGNVNGMGALPSMDGLRRFNGWTRARQSIETRRSMDCQPRVNGSTSARQWIEQPASIDCAAPAHVDHVIGTRMHFASVYCINTTISIDPLDPLLYTPWKPHGILTPWQPDLRATTAGRENDT